MATAAAGAAAAEAPRAPSPPPACSPERLAGLLDELYGTYKVEYYALLEELRAARAAAGGASGSAAGRGVDAAGSVRSALRAGRAAAAAAGAAAAAAAAGSSAAPSASAGATAEAAEAGEAPPKPASRAAAAGAAGGDDVTGAGSDTDPDAFSDAEAAAAAPPAAGGGPAAVASAAQLAAWKARFRDAAPRVAELEARASALGAQALDADGALAALCARRGAYAIRRTAVTLGRTTDSKGQVDVDLGVQGPAAKRVSRQQAQLSLEPDGGFRIRNVGRRTVLVNGAPLLTGDAAALPHLSVLDVAGIHLLFTVNALAVARAQARTPHALG